MKKNKGFTLSELLIVVAIIAVLVAISIPIFASQLHKARVAADWANVRAYYATLQADYISTGTFNSKVKTDWHSNPNYDWKHLNFLDGTKIDLLTGICAVSFDEKYGYSIEYQCNNNHDDCHLSLKNK